MGFSEFIPLLKLGEPVQKGNIMFCDFKFNFMCERLRDFYGSDLMYAIKFYNIWFDQGKPKPHTDNSAVSISTCLTFIRKQIIVHIFKIGL